MSVGNKLWSNSKNPLLRELADDEAFVFYDGVDRPLAVKAKSLEEFLTVLQTLEPSSIDFHSKRRDFESWVRALGDYALADRIGLLAKSQIGGQELKSRLNQIVGARVEKLRRYSSC